MGYLHKRKARKPGSVRGFCDDMTKNNIIKSAAKIAAKQSNATKEEEIIKQQDQESGSQLPTSYAIDST